MSALDRGRLQTLITQLGLTQREAASIIGVSHEALSRKLAGKDRYEVREEEIEALSRLKADVDRMVVQSVHHLASALANEPPENDEWWPIRLLIYRDDADLPATSGLPFASVHRVAVSRIAEHEALRGRAVAIMFDRDQYTDFLAGRRDTPDLRGEWAASQQAGPRFSFKLNPNSIGWAAFQETKFEGYTRKRGGVTNPRRNIHFGGKK